MTKRVLEVVSVKLSLRKSGATTLQIRTEGLVAGSNWRKGQLRPFVYGKPPADGIYEFEFVAEQGIGKAGAAIEKITAAVYLWPDVPKGFKGVKVYALENSVVKMK